MKFFKKLLLITLFIRIILWYTYIFVNFSHSDRKDFLKYLCIKEMISKRDFKFMICDLLIEWIVKYKIDVKLTKLCWMPPANGHALIYYFRYNTHRAGTRLSFGHAACTIHFEITLTLSLILSSPFRYRTMLQQVCESSRPASFVLYEAQTALRVNARIIWWTLSESVW